MQEVSDSAGSLVSRSLGRMGAGSNGLNLGFCVGI